MHRDEELQRIMTLACDHLGMQAAFVSELTATHQVYRAVAGAADGFGLVLDDGPRRSETYCDLLVAGKLPHVVPDARAEPQVRELPLTTDGPIGAYVGVPLTLSDGRLYGTFCCVSHASDTSLDERDAKFMDLLGVMVAGRVEVIEKTRREQAEIRRILDEGAVEVALQPIVSLTTSELRGAEALARFPGSSLEVEEAFALAARCGLGPDLELLALRLALPLLRSLPRGAYLSVNMSPDGIADPRFAEVMEQAGDLREVVLEVTEHAPVEQYARLLKLLAPLRAAGMRLAVDDVGAGYASFRHVLHLRPDIVKIDRSLVSGIADDPARRAIAGNVILLGLDLRAAVVAEGVDNPRDLDVLESIGADMAQGYLYARPSSDPAAWASWAGTLLRPRLDLTAEPGRTIPLPR